MSEPAPLPLHPDQRAKIRERIRASTLAFAQVLSGKLPTPETPIGIRLAKVLPTLDFGCHGPQVAAALSAVAGEDLTPYAKGASADAFSYLPGLVAFKSRVSVHVRVSPGTVVVSEPLGNKGASKAKFLHWGRSDADMSSPGYFTGLPDYVRANYTPATDAEIAAIPDDALDRLGECVVFA